MRSSRTSGILAGLPILCVIALSPACYDPAVRERVLMDFRPDGSIQLTVVTSFRQDKDLTQPQRDEIRHVVDLYELGRDPWLRGFKRAEARDVAHRREGVESAPEKIIRQATLPSVESFVEAMPDPIANFRLRENPRDGRVTLSIVHIDVPESIRDNRHRLEREVEALSAAVFSLTQRQCDLYDYLASHGDRRSAVLEAIGAGHDDPGASGVEVPAPPTAAVAPIPIEESLVLERFEAGLKGIDPFSAGPAGPTEPADRDKQSLAIAGMSFSAFDHDFCVRLPADAAGTVEAVGLAPSAADDEQNTWCIDRWVTDDLLGDLWAESEPPFSFFEQNAQPTPEVLSALPFTCLRYEDKESLGRRIWERILPRPYYELTWSRPSAAVPTVSE
jgi:hypothetical protein